MDTWVCAPTATTSRLSQPIARAWRLAAALRDVAPLNVGGRRAVGAGRGVIARQFVWCKEVTPTGSDSTAQGNALGCCCRGWGSPEGASLTGELRPYRAPFQCCT